jgi:tetratricopeptide (TPR) repeat protein
MAFRKGSPRILAALLTLAVVVGGSVMLLRRGPAKAEVGGPAPYHSAMDLLAAGRPVAAETTLRQAIAMDPAFGPAYAELGNLYLLRQDLPRALHALETASHLTPDRPHLFSQLAQAYTDARRPDEAYRAVARALASDPNDPLALAVHGELLLRDDNLTDALDAFQQALKSDPNFALAYLKTGFILVKLQRLEEAEVVLRQGLQRDTQNPGLHLQMGEVFFLRPQAPDAAELARTHYRQAIPNNPGAASAHSRLAELEMREGSLKVAREHWEKALITNPHMHDALYGLAQLETREGRQQQSEALLRRARAVRDEEAEVNRWKARVRAAPQDAALACRIARTALDRGGLAEAERQLERAIRWQPERREVRELRGRLFELQGRLDEARVEFRIASMLRRE